MITKKPRKGKTYQQILFSIVLTILIFGVIGFLIYSNWKINRQRTEMTVRIENLKKEISTLEKKKEELETLASESGQEGYLEKVAREQLNLQKPGEEVVAILAPEKEKEAPQEKKSFWQRILEKLNFR
jgi:cell division protein FtsB